MKTIGKFNLSSMTLIIALFLLSALFVYYLISNRQRRILLFLLVILLLVYFFQSIQKKNVITKELKPYNKVIEALYKYKKENSSFPLKISELVPKYIDKIPDLPNFGNISDIDYSPNWQNYSNSYFGKVFIGQKIPPFLFQFWGSGGLSGDTFIRYCPIEFDCRYKMKVSYEENGTIIDKDKIFEAKRIDNNWIKLKDY